MILMLCVGGDEKTGVIVVVPGARSRGTSRQVPLERHLSRK
jgi:hypothetical protein